MAMQWKTRRRAIDLRHDGIIMGIPHATPDSFSDGGQHEGEEAVRHAIRMQQDGAQIIDIGGESTRPGAAKVTVEEELSRVIPVIKKIREVSDVLISIDTSKAEVARKAIEAGADIVNDVSGCTADPEMISVCAETGAGIVVMHMQGTPQTMQDKPDYADVVSEVRAFFNERYATLTKAGVANDAICFDPGIGFGKTDTHYLTLMNALTEMAVQDRPVLLGVSRKSMIGRILEIEDAEDRDAATVALTTFARLSGCKLHRVHDVRKNYDAMRMIEEVMKYA